VIDHQGGVLIQPKYDVLQLIENGNILLVKQSKFGVHITTSGKTLLPKYDVRPLIINDSMIVVSESDEYLLVDPNGEKLNSTSYKQVIKINSSVMAYVLDETWTVHYLPTDSVLSQDIESIELYGSKYQTYCLIEKNNRVGIMSIENLVFLSPVYNKIENIGSTDEVLFKAEMFIPEAGTYLAVFYDYDHNVLQKLLVDQSDYDKFFCLN
jgi:hypothetical protein